MLGTMALGSAYLGQYYSGGAVAPPPIPTYAMTGVHRFVPAIVGRTELIPAITGRTRFFYEEEPE